MNGKHTAKLTSHVAGLERRLLLVQVWLNLPNKAIIHWIDLSTNFIQWTLRKLHTKDITELDVINGFPVLWKEYLEVTGKTDSVDIATL